MVSNALVEKLQEIEAEIQAGKKPKIVAFLKRVPQEERIECLRSILRCHLNVRFDAGKELSPNHYAKFGKKAVSIAADEIARLNQADSGNVDDATIVRNVHEQHGLSAARQSTVPNNDPDCTLDSDRKSQSAPASAAPPATATAPKVESIDRYRIHRVLGKGGFGCVYLGFDEKLERSVAIKVPHPRIIADQANVETYLNEARTVANLDHPNIVPVHDVGSTKEHPLFIVSKFIEGKELSSVINEQRMTFGESSALIAKIAGALHHAHKHGVVHRDIKPGNILIANDGTPHIVDFGLAFRDHDPLDEGRRIIGTPAYMSPEQASGEGHRINGQSDIFSLGVVFYELLAGTRPFHGKDITEVLSQIRRVEPRPLRQYEESIPSEMERICLKAISKKAKHRYSTAFDMAEDLHFCLDIPPVERSRTSASISGSQRTPPEQEPSSVAAISSSISQVVSGDVDSGQISIVPKGLRSFDVHDAEFFLHLLPGPRDRFGIPDSIRFWKTKLEEFNRENTFSVGLIYGPSGCGKSSFIKSGLLPQLDSSLKTVYIESTPDETEKRLLNGIKRHFPNSINSTSSLSETIAALRRGAGLQSGRKLVLILDQFEQWLHTRSNIADTELVRAIRHCDGERVQCIVAVRDDFWMGATRFMRELEIRQEEGNNSAAVDLFPARHARSVLLAFGQAFGAMPKSAADISDEQNRFLDDSIEELQTDQKVICVRLALFAEMMKNREWNSQSLSDVGGVEGLRVNFLEETFIKSSAPPRNRYHEKAVRRVLSSLVPEIGTDIKGEMKSWSELKTLSGYDSATESFEELIQILDNETRFITPTDPEGASAESTGLTQPDEKYYQLAHDYLVPSIQNWLALKQRETKQGRAELLLAERSSLWNSKPENRQLPTFLEYLGIRRHLKSDRWSTPQKSMMQKASRFYGVRTALASLAIALVAVTSWVVWQFNIESRNRETAADMVNLLVSAKTEKAPELIAPMAEYEQWTTPMMQQQLAEHSKDSTEHLHLSLGLVGTDPVQIEYLLDRLQVSSPEEVSAIRVALESQSDSIVGKLWTLTEDNDTLLPAASLLAKYDAEAAGWESIGARITEKLISENVEHAVQWVELLSPTTAHLVPSLQSIYLADDQARDNRDIDRVKDILRLCSNGHWSRVANLVVIARRGDFVGLFDQFSSRNQEARKYLSQQLEQSESAGSDLGIRKIANASIGLLKLGETEPFVRHVQNSSELEVRTYATQALRQSEVDSATILDLLENNKDTTTRIALIQILGTYPRDEVSQQSIDHLLNIFERDPDPGVHSSARWSLSKWGQAVSIGRVEQRLASATDPGAKQWYVSAKNDHTMSIFKGPFEYQIGSGEDQSRQEDELPSLMKINRSFAIGTTEVTVGQFEKFQKRDRSNDYPDEIAPTSEHPRIGVNWFQAAKYCRWLSEQEGIEESQMCYPKISQIKPGMRLAPDMLSKTGYRLPTEAEWEYSCRAGTTTGRFFGNDDAFISFYSWGANNSLEQTQPVGLLIPNDFGLHDTYGNVSEWCLQTVQSYKSYKGNDQLFELAIDKDVKRIIRGGCFRDQRASLRSALRLNHAPEYRAIDFGFRIARTMPKGD